MTTFAGVLTWYAVATGAPLYCDTYANDLTVGAVTEMWVAVPVELYSQGWQCGDWLIIAYNGEWHQARAYDAGPFGDNCVMQLDGGCLPIVADVPQPFAGWDGLSVEGTIVNASLRGRENGTIPVARTILSHLQYEHNRVTIPTDAALDSGRMDAAWQSLYIRW